MTGGSVTNQSHNPDDDALAEEAAITNQRRGMPSQRTARKGVLVGLAMSAVAAIGLVALAVFLFGDRMPELTKQKLAAAVARWEKHGPASYDMDLDLEGVWPGTVHVKVRGGVVVAMQRNGQTPKRRHSWDAWSVPGQFDTIEMDLSLAEDPAKEMGAEEGTRWLLRAEFDPQLGYPLGFQRVVFGGGPEVYWKVRKFKAQ